MNRAAVLVLDPGGGCSPLRHLTSEDAEAMPAPVGPQGVRWEHQLERLAVAQRQGDPLVPAGNGSRVKAETGTVMAALYGLPRAQIVRMVSFLDTTGDGTVSRAEFDTGIARLCKLPEGRALDPAAIWAALDRDGSGELSLTEIATTIRAK